MELDYSPPSKHKNEVVNIEKGDSSLESINHPHSARSTRKLISSSSGSDDQAETSFIENETTTNNDGKLSPVPTITKQKQRQSSADSFRKRENFPVTYLAVRDESESPEPRKRKTSQSYEIRSRRISQRKRSSATPLLIPDNYNEDDDETTFTEITRFEPTVKRRSGTMEPPNLEMLVLNNNDENDEPTASKSTGTGDHDDARLIKDGGFSPRIPARRGNNRFRDFGNDEEEDIQYGGINRESIDSVVPTERIIRNIEEKKKKLKSQLNEKPFNKKPEFNSKHSNLSNFSVKSHITLKDLNINFHEADDVMDENEAIDLVKRFSSAVKTIYNKEKTFSGVVSPMPPFLPPLLKGATGGKSRKKSKSKKRKNSTVKK